MGKGLSAAKCARWFFAGVIGLYLLMAAGLGILNRTSSSSSRSSEAALQYDSNEPHRLRIQSGGVHSFHARLELIEKARKSLELEFFIYNVDEASRILTNALIKKANEGVKVRLLVDFSGPVTKLKPVYARYLRTKGIEVRYYNNSALYNLIGAQHRSHRKLLMVDDEVFVTGGRNIGNEYFDLSEDYNFLDTDVEVRGPMVATVDKSFELYWTSDLSETPEGAEEELNEADWKMVRAFLDPQEKDAQILAQVREIGGLQATRRKAHECRDISFVTDFPGQGETHRRVFRRLIEELDRAEKEVVAESPYFVIKGGGYKVLDEARKRGLQVRVLTNSLHSTDAFYTVASIFMKINWLAKSGLELYVFKGEAVEGQSFTGHSGYPGRWGVHSKRAVIDDKTVLVGTYNVDPRSANLNSEMMIVCRNNLELAAEMKADMEARFAGAAAAIENGAAHPLPILQGAQLHKILLMLLSVPLANLFDFLM